MRALLLFAGALALAGPVFAQTPDEDWELATNVEQQLTLATLDFGGTLLALRCRDGELDMLLTGVPVSIGTTRTVQVSAGEIRNEEQVWLTRAGEPILSVDEPARLARQLRGGGELDVRLDGETEADRPRRYRLPVPASIAAINTVLSACDIPLEEPRDLITRIPVGSAPAWREPPRPEYPDNPGALRASNAVVRVSCLVGPEWELVDCRADSENPAGHGFAGSAITAVRRAKIDPPRNGADVRGGLVRFTLRFSLS